MPKYKIKDEIITTCIKTAKNMEHDVRQRLFKHEQFIDIKVNNMNLINIKRKNNNNNNKLPKT